MTKVRRLPRSPSPSGAGTSEQERHPAAPTLPRHAVDLLRNLWVAFGPWRLLLATGLALAVAGTAPFPANAPPSAVDAAVLDWMEEQMPSGLGRLLAFVYPMTGTRFTAALVLSVLFFLMTRRYWAEMACLAAGTGGILLLNNYSTNA